MCDLSVLNSQKTNSKSHKYKEHFCLYFKGKEAFCDLFVLNWTSLAAQLVKNLPVMWGNLGLILGLGRSLGEGKGYHFSILAWRIPTV